jgi:hypothetical protein
LQLNATFLQGQEMSLWRLPAPLRHRYMSQAEDSGRSAVIRLAAMQDSPGVFSIAPEREGRLRPRLGFSRAPHRLYIPESHGITVGVVSSGTFELGDQGSPLLSLDTGQALSLSDHDCLTHRPNTSGALWHFPSIFQEQDTATARPSASWSQGRRQAQQWSYR